MTVNGTMGTMQGTEPTSVTPWYGATLSTTTEEDVEQQQQQQQYFVQYDLSDSLRKAVPPVVLLLGTFGNVMTMLVMRAVRPQFGDPSMPVFFLCLAACDQVVLALGLGRQWVRTVFLYDVRNQDAVVCKLHKFLLHAGSRMATWILVAVTSQRVMTVMRPLRQRLTSTRKRATAVVLVIVGVCCLLDVGILVMYSPRTKNGRTKCQPVKDSPRAAMYEDKVYPWLNNVTGSWLPFVILVVNNVILGVKVRQSATASRHMTDSQQSDARSKQATSLSITLIVTSLAFILLTSSIPATFVVKKIYAPSSPLSTDGKREADLMLANVMLDLLWYCNSAVNFYLYFLTGTTFRQEARRLLCSRRRCLPCKQCCTGTEAIEAETGTTSALPVKDSSQPQPQ